MSHKKIVLFLILFLSPALCFGSNGTNNGFNWVPIISSIFVGGIFVISSLVKEKSKTDTKNILYKKIDTSGIKKVFKTAITIILIFGMFSLLILPLTLNQSANQKYNGIISIIATAIIMLIYTKINKNGKY